MCVEVEGSCLISGVDAAILVVVTDNDVGCLLVLGAVLFATFLSIFLFFCALLFLLFALGFAVRKFDKENVNDDVENDQW